MNEVSSIKYRQVQRWAKTEIGIKSSSINERISYYMTVNEKRINNIGVEYGLINALNCNV